VFVQLIHLVKGSDNCFVRVDRVMTVGFYKWHGIS
jgi:hypothetical protein